MELSICWPAGAIGLWLQHPSTLQTINQAMKYDGGLRDRPMCLKQEGIGSDDIMVCILGENNTVRVLHKLDEMGNNAIITIRCFTMCKKSSNKQNVTRTSHFKSDAFLSELTWHLLVRQRL